MLVALLFSQLAVSAHACPLEMSMQAATEGSSAAMPSDEAPPVPSPVCDKHCNPSEQAQQPAILPVLPMGPVLAVLTRTARLGAEGVPPDFAHAVAPPLIIQYCVLRI